MPQGVADDHHLGVLLVVFLVRKTANERLHAERREDRRRDEDHEQAIDAIRRAHGRLHGRKHSYVFELVGIIAIRDIEFGADPHHVAQHVKAHDVVAPLFIADAVFQAAGAYRIQAPERIADPVKVCTCCQTQAFFDHLVQLPQCACVRTLPEARRSRLAGRTHRSSASRWLAYYVHSSVR